MISDYCKGNKGEVSGTISNLVISDSPAVMRCTPF